MSTNEDLNSPRGDQRLASHPCPHERPTARRSSNHAFSRDNAERAIFTWELYSRAAPPLNRLYEKARYRL